MGAKWKEGEIMVHNYNRWLKILFLLAIFSFSPVMVLAGPPGPPPGGPGGGPGGPPPDALLHHAEELGLSEEAVAEIEAILQEAESSMDVSQQELKAAHQALHELLAVDEPDMDTVMQHIELIGAIQTDIQKVRIKTMVAVRAKLTTEQREMLKTLGAKHMKEMGEHPHHGPPPHCDGEDRPEGE